MPRNVSSFKLPLPPASPAAAVRCTGTGVRFALALALGYSFLAAREGRERGLKEGVNEGAGRSSEVPTDGLLACVLFLKPRVSLVPCCALRCCCFQPKQPITKADMTEDRGQQAAESR
jgi:hypothetical protein